MNRARAAFIILAAGSGTRFGSASIPKQLIPLGPERVLDWSLKAARASGLFERVVVVWPASESEKPHWYNWLRAADGPDLICVEGGKTRTDSVRAALFALSCHPEELVFIHDAARPGLNANILNSLMTAMDIADCAAPLLPVIDALKNIDTPETPKNVDRNTLRRIQTPQAFRFGLLNEALNSGDSFDDDISALMAHTPDAKFEAVDGSEKLRKLTYPEDLVILETMLLETPSPALRIGTGFDVHAFEVGDSVTLCGVNIPHTQKLAGHSDADVGWHALTDAILGALALGDIGDHFPPSDPQWKGVASEVFLRHAVSIAREAGYTVANVDLTLICEAPKIAPHRQAMRETTAMTLGVPPTRISIKATTTEKLGFTGRREGIAAQASVLMQKSA